MAGVKWSSAIHPTLVTSSNLEKPMITETSEYERAKEVYEEAKESYEIALAEFTNASEEIEKTRDAMIKAREAFIIALGNDKIEEEP